MKKSIFQLKFSIFEKSDFFSENQNFQNKKSSRWKNIFHSDFFWHQGIHLYYPKNTLRATSDTSKDVQTLLGRCHLKKNSRPPSVVCLRSRKSQGKKNETLVSRKKRVFEDFGNFLGDFNSFDIHFSSPQAEKIPF